MSLSHSTLSPKKTKLNPINKNNILRNNLKNLALSQENNQNMGYIPNQSQSMNINQNFILNNMNINR